MDEKTGGVFLPSFAHFVPRKFLQISKKSREEEEAKVAQESSVSLRDFLIKARPQSKNALRYYLRTMKMQT